MTPYASAEELRVWMGHGPFDPEQTQRAQMMVDAATGVIDGELQMLDPAGTLAGLALRTETVALNGTGTRKLLLPRWPVAEVSSVILVKDDGTQQLLVAGPGTGTDYTLDGAAGILTRLRGVWPCGDGNVLVANTAGYTVISRDVWRCCLRLASIGWENPAGAETEDLGDRRVRWATPGMELTTSEKNMLSIYAARP